MAWTQYLQRSNGSEQNIYYTVRDTGGGEVRPVSQLTNDGPGNDDSHYYPNVAALGSNRALFTWTRGGNYGDIHYAVADSSGNILMPMTNLSGDGASQWDWLSDAVQLQNGRTIVAWTGGNPYRIRYAILDAGNNRISGPTTLYNAASLTGDAYVSVAASGDTAVLTWMDYNSSMRRNLYYALIGADGAQVTPPQIFRTSQASSPYIESSFSGYGNTSSSVFRPDPDGYSFTNRSRPLPSWDVFKQTFANSDLEYPGGIPKPVARIFYEITYRRVFAGVCDGMASTSVAYWQDAVARPGGQLRTHSLSAADAWPLIDLYHGRQLSKGLQAYRNNLWQNNPGVDGVYAQIKARLPVWFSDPWVLSFIPGPDESVPANQEFGHSVVPYWIEELPGQWGKIYVYDPNFPADRQRYFFFDFQASPHTFQYDMGFPIPGTSQGNYVVRSGDGWIIELTPLSQFDTYDAKILHDGIMGWIIGAGEVTHSTAAGQQSGDGGSGVRFAIPGAAPIYQPIAPGASVDAHGFSLPAGDYRATVRYTGDYEYTAVGPQMALSIGVTGVGGALSQALAAGEDTISLSAAAAAYTSTLAFSHPLSFQLASNIFGQARRYGVTNATLAGPGRLQGEVVPNGLELQTANLTGAFDLDIRGWEAGAASRFVHRGITTTVGDIFAVDAPSLGLTDVVTVSVSATPGGPVLQTYILDNQVHLVYLPIIFR